ncbi:enoyl-CoA hydratase/isomerase family protein [Thalassotalea fonticola]|uniref:3-hydroxyisobutyryl-CoA hydrolase n=1 Tax=Thalassotalea fonticola TaxID=3065649 RepID=A0ABZ0GQ05_9GAMM|nr:enoyl-CoA hydratase/isomerase family protein [Colwelliaceae bacterium S1-1]
MSEVVLFEELSCSNGKKIAVATLNAERSLNALSHDMVKQLYPQLSIWQKDRNIAAVFLQGAGEKAFCAGGDIVHLYNNLPEKNGDPAPGIEEFFRDEYQLDYLIHTFDKPFIVWGNGIVMGGGLGLMAGGSHRIVTETTRIAMPEISIGLYPDVGGSYFLNKMPGNSGLFLGLTGASINAADAKYTHLADHFINNDKKLALLDELLTVNWGDTIALNHQKLSSLIVGFEQRSIANAPISNVQHHQSLITELTNGDNLTSIVDNILTFETEDKWLSRAKTSLAHGSPISAMLTYRQLQESANLSLLECFRLELGVSTKCGEFGEFKEGVRALLIEKDNNPQWKYNSVSDVEANVIDWFFTSPWTKTEHPLASL